MTNKKQPAKLQEDFVLAYSHKFQKIVGGIPKSQDKNGHIIFQKSPVDMTANCIGVIVELLKQTTGNNCAYFSFADGEQFKLTVEHTGLGLPPQETKRH